MYLKRFNPFTPFGWVLVVGMLSFIAYACTNPQPQASAAAAPATEEILKPIPKENGLYYFPFTGDQYIRALEQFHGKNPDLICEYQGVNTAGAYAYPIGHILHCRDSAVPA